MSSTDIRGRVSVDTNVPKIASGFPIDARAFQDGTLGAIDWRMLKVMEGKVFQLQIGTEDAPVDSTATIDDLLVWGVVDVPEGIIAIPIRAEVHVADFTTATDIFCMLEVDNAKQRYTSGGTAFTPLNLNTGSSSASGCSAYAGTDITVGAKTTGGSIEVARVVITEDNVGTGIGGEKFFFYDDVCPPFVKGPASIILHFGAGSADAKGFGLVKWVELTV